MGRVAVDREGEDLAPEEASFTKPYHQPLRAKSQVRTRKMRFMQCCSQVFGRDRADRSGPRGYSHPGWDLGESE